MPNKEIVRNSFSRSHSTYHNAAIVQSVMATELVREIAKYQCQFNRVLELGVGTGLLTDQLTSQVKIETLFCNDLMDASNFVKRDCQFIVGDAEKVDYPDHLDLITSNAVVQWFDDLPRFLKKSANHLNKGGLIAFTTFGPNNFKELRQVTGQGLDYFSLPQLEKLLLSDYDLVFSFETEQVLKFKNIKGLLNHLKETGVNGLNGKALSKSLYRQLIQNYSTENGFLNLTYHPITLIAKKK